MVYIYSYPLISHKNNMNRLTYAAPYQLRTSPAYTNSIDQDVILFQFLFTRKFLFGFNKAMELGQVSTIIFDYRIGRHDKNGVICKMLIIDIPCGSVIVGHLHD